MDAANRTCQSVNRATPHYSPGVSLTPPRNSRMRKVATVDIPRMEAMVSGNPVLRKSLVCR